MEKLKLSTVRQQSKKCYISMKQIIMAFTFGFSLALFLFLIIDMFAYDWWGLFLLSEDMYDVLATTIGDCDYFYIIKVAIVLLLSISSVFTINYIGDIINKKGNDNNDNIPPRDIVVY